MARKAFGPGSSARVGVGDVLVEGVTRTGAIMGGVDVRLATNRSRVVPTADVRIISIWGV